MKSQTNRHGGRRMPGHSDRERQSVVQGKGGHSTDYQSETGDLRYSLGFLPVADQVR